MAPRIVSRKKKPKGGGAVTAVTSNGNVGDITKGGCSQRSTILLVVVVCLLMSPGMASGRKTKRLRRTLEVTQAIKEHAPGNTEDGTGNNSGKVTDKNCEGISEVRTFPNLDYSFLGYNILKGYPLSVGHDPGFTFPIFVANYTPGHRTDDCRYKVPTGLMIIPDVSCEISFTSKVAKNEDQMSKALSVSANVGGGGWGVEFSASAEYKTSSSEMRSGESVFIVSTATCGYFFNDLITMQPPALHPLFLAWVKKLADADKKIYFDFFDIFGTHFSKRVTYGARYSYRYKMKWEAYEKREESDVNVAVQASYSGMFSVSGGAGMTDDQKKQAKSFSKDVESKLITTGAVPLAEGGAAAWAAAVKENPLPISYDLESIENLFTPAFMPEQDKDKIKKIADNISKFKMDYSESLRMKGQVYSSVEQNPGIELKHRELHHWYSNSTKCTYRDCIQSCLDDSRCYAIDYCIACSGSSNYHEVCFKYGTYGGHKVITEREKKWNTVIFNEKIENTFTFLNIMIKGNPRIPVKESDRHVDQSSCLALCLKDVHCTAITYQPGKYRTSTCLLYWADYIKDMAENTDAVTMFIPWKQRAKALRNLEKLQIDNVAMAFEQV